MPGSVYVVQGATSITKVGLSVHFPSRLVSLKAQFREFGDEVVRYVVCDEIQSPRRAELRLISAMAEKYAAYSGREWFSGADFDEAVALAHVITEECRGFKAQQPITAKERAASEVERKKRLAELRLARAAWKREYMEKLAARRELRETRRAEIATRAALRAVGPQIQRTPSRPTAAQMEGC